MSYKIITNEAHKMGIDPALVKAVIITALLLCVLFVIAGCSSPKEITLSNGGWISVSEDGKLIQSVGCNFTDKTIQAKGLLNYAGAQKTLTFKKMSVACDNENHSLDTTFKVAK